MSQAYPLAFDEQPRGAGGPGAAEHIARVLHDSGVDVPGSLYDEALALIGDGRLGPATDRLRMLRTLDPSAGEAALLLRQVPATRGQAHAQTFRVACRIDVLSIATEGTGASRKAAEQAAAQAAFERLGKL